MVGRSVFMLSCDWLRGLPLRFGKNLCHNTSKLPLERIIKVSDIFLSKLGKSVLSDTTTRAKKWQQNNALARPCTTMAAPLRSGRPEEAFYLRLFILSILGDFRHIYPCYYGQLCSPLNSGLGCTRINGVNMKEIINWRVKRRLRESEHGVVSNWSPFNSVYFGLLIFCTWLSM